jgi:tRNA threonylcarbamoyladenosine biosynthesis protein TsaB
MRLLLLNTCGTEGSAALADATLGAPILARETMPGRTASERLMVVIRAMLTMARWRLSDLAAIAVVTGPGSFTGVRVGLSAAKGLSEASGVPLIAISRLEMLAAAAGCQGRVCALLDAGRGELYCGEYEDSSKLAEGVLSWEDVLIAARKAEAVVVCEQAVAAKLERFARLRIVDEPKAADALPLALSLLAHGSFSDPMTLDANYLRRTDAEIFAKPTVKRTG